MRQSIDSIRCEITSSALRDFRQAELFFRALAFADLAFHLRSWERVGKRTVYERKLCIGTKGAYLCCTDPYHMCKSSCPARLSSSLAARCPRRSRTSSTSCLLNRKKYKNVSILYILAVEPDRFDIWCRRSRGNFLP